MVVLEFILCSPHKRKLGPGEARPMFGCGGSAEGSKPLFCFGQRKRKYPYHNHTSTILSMMSTDDLLKTGKRIHLGLLSTA